MSFSCDSCGTPVSEDAHVCPVCGTLIQQIPKREDTGAMAVPPKIGVRPLPAPPPGAVYLLTTTRAVALPPPTYRSRRWGILAIPIPIALIAVILSLVVKPVSGGHASPATSFWNTLLFAFQMLLLTTVICLIPTLVSWIVRRGSYAILTVVESAMFVAAFAGFGIWLFGATALGTWILYAAALVLIIEAGSRFVVWRKDTTLKRLKDGTSYKSLEADRGAIEKMARYEVALYIAVPSGLILGTIIGLIRRQSSLHIIEFCVQVVLFLAACVLLYFLVIGFLRMSDPLFKTIPAAVPDIAKSRRKGKKAANAPALMQADQDQQYIDFATDVSGLRTIYKYDALHNTILLVAFILIVIKIWLVPISLSWMIISLLLGTLVFSEIPYAIGQYLLHNRILEQYTGGKYVEMAKKLQDYSPVFPPLPILAALLTSGTAGGILYALLNQIVQNSLTTLIK
jgi:hypothetical protein